MDIGHMIKKGLQRAGMKQSEFAEKIGKPRQLVNDWVHNRKSPESESFIQIVRILNLVSDVFPSDDQKSSEVMSLEEMKKRIERIEQALQDKGIVKIENNNGHIVNNVHGKVKIESSTVKK